MYSSVLIGCRRKGSYFTIGAKCAHERIIPGSQGSIPQSSMVAPQSCLSALQPNTSVPVRGTMRLPGFFTVIFPLSSRLTAPVSICLPTETNAFSSGFFDALLRRNRVAMYPQHMHELVFVRICGQHRRKNRRPRRYKWSACPPDVQVVRRWQSGHRTALADALFAQCGNRQPGLDQAFGHVSRCSWARRLHASMDRL